MLRIEKESDGLTTTLRLIGRIQSAEIGSIRAQMDDDSVHVPFDLGEVTLVNVEVIRFLSDCGDEGAVLIHSKCASGLFASKMNGHGGGFRVAPDSFACVQTIELA